LTCICWFFFFALQRRQEKRKSLHASFPFTKTYFYKEQTTLKGTLNVWSGSDEDTFKGVGGCLFIPNVSCIKNGSHFSVPGPSSCIPKFIWTFPYDMLRAWNELINPRLYFKSLLNEQQVFVLFWLLTFFHLFYSADSLHSASAPHFLPKPIKIYKDEMRGTLGSCLDVENLFVLRFNFHEGKEKCEKNNGERQGRSEGKEFRDVIILSYNILTGNFPPFMSCKFKWYSPSATTTTIPPRRRRRRRETKPRSHDASCFPSLKNCSSHV